MPIFFHCSRIISLIRVNWTNWPPSVMISMRSRPCRRRSAAGSPSASFLARPTLSSISLACLHVERRPLASGTRGPGCTCSLVAGTTEPGVPVPSQNVSLIWSRSIPSDSARRKSVVAEPLADLGVGLVAQVELDDHVGAEVAGVEVPACSSPFCWFSMKTGSLPMSRCRSCMSYSPAMARRLMTSRFSASVSWTLSMYGSWLPSVSTQTLYGFRSSVQSGVLIGVHRLPGRQDGQLRVQVPVVLALEQADPVVEPGRP